MTSSVLRRFFPLLLFGLFWAGSLNPLHAQSTTASLRGKVLDEAGESIPGVNVVATHEPTGTTYGAATTPKGRYTILNMRVGGPYTVRASFVGYQTVEKTEVMLDLNEKAVIDFTLRPKTEELEGIEVVAQRSSVIDANRTGAATNIDQEQIDALPSISRSITDFARLTPQYTGGGSLVGANDRYNNISIDGATLDDVFGLGDAVPGSQAGTQPISLDAIEEFQINIAPYDVRKSGFTGGQINAVTKSGTNEYEGLVRYLGRTEQFTGDRNGLGTGEFNRQFFIGNFGGPIIEDELFFFVNAEMVLQNNPLNTGIASGPNAFTVPDAFLNRYGYDDTQSVMNEIRQIASDSLGYNPGGTSTLSQAQDSYKFLAKVDWNINDNNRLTLRHNYVKGIDDTGIGRNEDAFDFSSRQYQFNSVQNSTVAQLNTTIGDNMFNEARVVYTRIRDERDIGNRVFSDVDLFVVEDEAEVGLGPGRFNQANRLDQDLIEITNDFSYIVGDHNITVGTNNQIWRFENLFIQDFYGQFEFEELATATDTINAVEAFRRGQPARYRFSYATPQAGTEQPTAGFTAFQLGGYVQDEWQVLDDLRLTLGLRVDVPVVPDEPTFNQTAYEAYGLNTSRVASGNPLWSPRLGFNYQTDVLGDRFETQIRGGVGLFAGDPPFVWVSNQFSNSGADFFRIDESFGYDDYYGGDAPPNGRRFLPRDLGGDVRGQLPRAGDSELITPVETTEINVVSDDFKYPQVFRTSLAIDQQLPYGFTATFEGLYSNTVNDVTFTNLNFEQVDTSLYGRPIYEEGVSDRFTNTLLMRNTNEGYSYSGTVQLQRRVREGLGGSLSYTLNESRSVNTGSSSRAISNWQFNENVDVNDPGLGRTDQALRHRVLGTLNYRFDYLDRFATTIGLIYDGRSGSPFSWIYSGNANGDTRSDNDLVYVPNSPDEIVLESNNWEAMDAFISAWDGLDDYRGEFTKRNIDIGPWSHRLDLQISQNITTINGQKVELTATMENVLNSLNDDWGLVRFVSFQNETAWDFNGYVGEGDVGSEIGGQIITEDDLGKPIVNFNEEKLQETASDDVFQVSDIASRWQLQLGIRYTF